MKFDDEFTVERTKILPELSINNIVKILSLEKQYTLVTLNRTPLQADDAEITDYLSKFGTLKGPIKRRTYTEGPLKGIENGTITALMSLATPIPSYHYLREKYLLSTTKAWLKRASGASNQAKNVKTSYLETVVPARRLAPKNPPSKITSLTYGPALDGTRKNTMKTTRVANQQQISP